LKKQPETHQPPFSGITTFSRLPHTTSVGDQEFDLAVLGIPFDGEDELSRRILIKEGVPEKAIRILSPTIVNTVDEMNVIADALQSEKGGAVIIVTSKAHTRRVHALWNNLEAGRGKLVVRAAATDSFDASHWWRSTSDALDVVREVLGLFNVWAGLPLKPTK